MGPRKLIELVVGSRCLWNLEKILTNIFFGAVNESMKGSTI